MSTELVKEFEAALTMPMGLSEAVAAIQTLLQFIKNCKGMCMFEYLYTYMINQALKLHTDCLPAYVCMYVY